MIISKLVPHAALLLSVAAVPLRGHGHDAPEEHAAVEDAVVLPHPSGLTGVVGPAAAEGGRGEARALQWGGGTRNRHVYCGRWNKCEALGGNKKEVWKGQKHAVRCCTEDPDVGWPDKCKDPKPSPRVYAESDLPFCSSDRTFDEAVAICESYPGGRLCSQWELKKNCARGTGCGHDRRHVWGCSGPGKSCAKDAECCHGECTADGTCRQEVRCPTCLEGRVGHWDFDGLVDGYVSSPIDTYGLVEFISERGSSPALVGVDALIVGGGSDPPLVEDGRFGRALSVGYGVFMYPHNWGVENFAQMSSMGLFQSTHSPYSHFTVSIWLKWSYISRGNSLVWEREGGDIYLDTRGDSRGNRLEYGLGARQGPLHTSVSHDLSGLAGLDRWFHVACSYDGALNLFVDGSSVAKARPPSPFAHGSADGAPLGVGNRASSTATPGDAATQSAFVGALDDLVVWDRALAPSEVRDLYASGVAAADQIPSESPTRSPTGSPMNIFN